MRPFSAFLPFFQVFLKTDLQVLRFYQISATIGIDDFFRPISPQLTSSVCTAHGLVRSGFEFRGQFSCQLQSNATIRQNFAVHSVPGDGKCLFHCFSLLVGSNWNHDQEILNHEGYHVSPITQVYSFSITQVAVKFPHSLRSVISAFPLVSFKRTMVSAFAKYPVKVFALC